MRVLIIEARFYDDLLDELERGATGWLEEQGIAHDIIHVPGALEIPGVIAMAEGADMAAGMMAEEAGGQPIPPRYDAYVALGVVIRGETWHFEIVAGESARGLMELTLQGAAIGNGILTVENAEQAWARARVSEKNKGAGAARAAVEMARVKQKLLEKALS